LLRRERSYFVCRAFDDRSHAVLGALKKLLDCLPVEVLHGKPVGILVMGATPHQYLGVDWQLRAVLQWFGALKVPVSVYLTSADFTVADPSRKG